MNDLKHVKLAAPQADRAALDASAASIFAMFLARETEFAVNENVVIDYPAIAGASPFLHDPLGYIAASIGKVEAGGGRIGRVVVLTTFADVVGVALEAAGYRATRIDMPAGPDFTSAYRLDLGAAGKTLYIEAVNETDEKIRPSFSLELRDGDGQLAGGACGSIHRRDGRTHAYLATMTLGPGLPPGTGTTLGEAVDSMLRAAGVSTIHLGTQTAGPFYQRLGYRVVHTVLPKLRYRVSASGDRVCTDLVMLARDLD